MAKSSSLKSIVEVWPNWSEPNAAQKAIDEKRKAEKKSIANNMAMIDEFCDYVEKTKKTKANNRAVVDITDEIKDLLR